jgi:hypothetical protein
MARSAPAAFDWNSNVIALLVTGSTLWFGGFLRLFIVTASLGRIQTYQRDYPCVRKSFMRNW